MFATPSTSGRSTTSRRLPFSAASHHPCAVDVDGELDEELDEEFKPPVPSSRSEAGGGGEANSTTRTEESSEVLSILRNIQRQVSALQAKQSTGTGAVSPAASASMSSSSTNSSPVERKLPKELTVSFGLASVRFNTDFQYVVLSSSGC